MPNLIAPKVGTPWDIICDGDDTLWACGRYYDAAATLCCQFIQLEFPHLHTETARRRCRAIQAALIDKYGYYFDLYEDAWAEVYLQLCHHQGQAVYHETLGNIYDAAASVHRAPYSVFPGVSQTLGQLQTQGHRLHLLTLGDNDWQRDKVRRNHLDRFFTSIHVVQRSKGPQMRLLAANPLRTMVVGDSLLREMVPSWRLGYTSVWIRSDDKWHATHHQIDFNRLHIINRFTEISSVVAKLNGQSHR